MMTASQKPNNIFKKVIEEVVDEKLSVFEIKVDKKLEVLREDLVSVINEKHNQVMKVLDGLMGIYKKHGQHTPVQ